MSKWLNYNVSQQTYYPQTVNDVISDKYDIIHNKIYVSALNAAINENSDLFHKYDNDGSIDIENNKSRYVLVDNDNKYIDLNEYRITEVIEDKNYLLPTKVLFVYRKKLINRFTLDLSKYWNYEFEVENNFFDSSQFITNYSEDWYKYNDVINYDYINGKATIQNRVETKTKKIDFCKISLDDNIKIDYQI